MVNTEEYQLYSLENIVDVISSIWLFTILKKEHYRWPSVRGGQWW